MKCGAEDYRLLFIYSFTWFGAFRPRLLKLRKSPKSCKSGITQLSEDLNTRAEPNLIWNVELKTWDYFLCCFTWLMVFWVIFPKLPQSPNTCETGITLLLEGLDTRLRPHLMWNVELKTFNYFLRVPVHDLEVFRPCFPKLP